MKKQLLITLLTIIPFFVSSQSIFITSIVEGACGTSSQEAPRVIELYVDGTLDTSSFNIEVQIGTSWFFPSVFSGTYTDEFLYIISDGNAFDTEFPGIPATNKQVGNAASFADGVRAVRIIDTANANAVVDIYGVDGTSGSGESWEYSNTYAKRNDGTSGSAIFSSSNWTFNAIDALVGLGSCNSSAILDDTVQLGSYSPMTSLSDRDALITIYNALNGPNWNNTWDLAANENTWNGVTVDATSGRVTSLAIQSDNITGTIPAEVQFLTELEELTLRASSVSASLGAIPEELYTLSNLEILALRGDYSGGISNSLGNLTNLETLEFNGGLTGNIPNSISNLTSLKSLNLNGTGLTGSLPAGLFNISAIERLFFQNNFSLSATLDASIGNLINLNSALFQNIDLSLSNGIPEQLYDLTDLTFLVFNNTDIGGTISSSIGNLVNLSTLRLSDNSFTGSLPNEIGLLTNLVELLIGRNGLTGIIPNEIGNLTNLVLLTLFDNDFTGVIPSSFENLTSLIRLIITDTQLEGSIPTSFNQFSNLSVLELRNNNFSGSLPDFTGLPLSRLRIENNAFVFDDFETEFTSYSGLAPFTFSPQDNVDTPETLALTVGDDIVLSVDETTSSNNIYQWRKDGIDIPNANQSTFTITNATALDAGDYDCVITNSIVTGLTLNKNIITLDFTLSNQEFLLSDIRVYPNPAKDVLTISLSEFGTNGIKATVINLVGQTILTKSLSSDDDIINTSNFDTGVYILRLDLDGKSYTQRIIKE